MNTNKSTKRRTYGERSRYNPFCPLDWRWQTAGKIARKEARSTREDDPALQGAIRLRTRMDQGRPYKRPQGLTRAILDALPVYEEDKTQRWELEARLVVGQTDEEICHHTGLAPDVVNAYECVFCDVRPYLHAHGYLATQFFGDRVFTGFGNNDVGHLWAWLALSGHKLVLDRAIRAFKRWRRPGEPPTISSFLAGKARLNLRAFVANAVLPWDYPLRAMLGGRKGRATLLTMPFERKVLPDKVLERVVQCAQAYLDGRPVPKCTLDHMAEVQVDNTRSTTKDTKPEMRPSSPEPHTEGDGWAA